MMMSCSDGQPTSLMWLWWEMIPTEDFTDVTVVRLDTDDHEYDDDITII